MLTKQATSTIRGILSIHSRYNIRTSTALTHKQPNQITRSFNTESEYHDAADHTLHTIQDTLDFYFEDNPTLASPDIDFSAGVLTIALPQGTWVLNKQTPNQQIWWSSPITGPRRYEYLHNGTWIWSRYVDFQSAGKSEEWDDTKHLGEALKKEMVDLFHIHDGLEDLDDL